ncbi:MAG: hypothetical protein GWN87_09230, partial [Desulfuromonadales bacterium]|nr:hypothetical protein [Desulfuromonadales bacterium]
MGIGNAVEKEKERLPVRAAPVVEQLAEIGKGEGLEAQKGALMMRMAGKAVEVAAFSRTNRHSAL